MTERTLNPVEDDALLCVEFMKPRLQNVIDQHFRGDTLIYAMTTTFAELAHERGGSRHPLDRAVKAFLRLPAAVRKQVPDCNARIKTVIEASKKEGFSLDAILWSMLGAIINLYQALRVPKRDIEIATSDMIMRINEARRLTVN